MIRLLCIVAMPTIGLMPWWFFKSLFANCGKWCATYHLLLWYEIFCVVCNILVTKTKWLYCSFHLYQGIVALCSILRTYWTALALYQSPNNKERRVVCLVFDCTVILIFCYYDLCFTKPWQVAWDNFCWIFRDILESPFYLLAGIITVTCMTWLVY